MGSSRGSPGTRAGRGAGPARPAAGLRQPFPRGAAARAGCRRPPAPSRGGEWRGFAAIGLLSGAAGRPSFPLFPGEAQGPARGSAAGQGEAPGGGAGGGRGPGFSPGAQRGGGRPGGAGPAGRGEEGGRAGPSAAFVAFLGLPAGLPAPCGGSGAAPQAGWAASRPRAGPGRASALQDAGPVPGGGFVPSVAIAGLGEGELPTDGSVGSTARAHSCFPASVLPLCSVKLSF